MIFKIMHVYRRLNVMQGMHRPFNAFVFLAFLVLNGKTSATESKYCLSDISFNEWIWNKI